MTAPTQHDEKWVAAEVWLQRYLSPLVSVTPWQTALGSKLWATGMPKPYRAVRRITGPRDEFTDEPVMRVHTFDATYTGAAIEAARNDDMIVELVRYPGWAVTMPDSSVVRCEWAEITEAAHEEDYGAESVVTRFVSEYRFGFSDIPA